MTNLRLLALSLNFCFLPYASASDDAPRPSRATMAPHAGPQVSDDIALTLTDAVFLGLRNNRSIRSSYYERISQKFDLRVSEDQFTPKMTITSRTVAYRSRDDRFRNNQISPSVTMMSELGTRFSLSWANQTTRSDYTGRARSDDISFNIIQPLLKGAGRDIATAPVRQARLAEISNKLVLKANVSGIVTQIILAYRELLRAQEQLRIARDALSRSQTLVEVNKSMISAGRMAQVEIVQAEADAASQELTVEESYNQLDAGRIELLRLLALTSNTHVRAVDKLDAKQMILSQPEALRVALEQQPDYLTQIINGKQASINLDLANNNKLWDISLIGGASQGRDLYSDESARANSRRWEGYAGIQVEIPIGDLNQKREVIRAQVDQANQELQFDEARQVLEQNVTSAIRDIGTRWRQFEIAQRALALSRQKLDIEKQKLQVGRSSNFQVLSYESDLRNAESTTLNTLITYLNTETQLDRTLGTTLDSWDIYLND